MLATALGGALVAWMRGTLPGARRYWIPLVLIPFAVLFLLLPVSLPIWNLLPKLRYLQFPWRWLLVLEAPMSVFFATAVWFAPLRMRIAAVAACALLFVAISGGAWWLWFQNCLDGQEVLIEREQVGLGFNGESEYDPQGANYTEVRYGQPGACLVSAPSTPSGQGKADASPVWDGNPARCRAFTAVMYVPEHKWIEGLADHAGYLILRLRSYPAWRVTVNGRPAIPVVERRYGLMAVPVPQGHVDVNVVWGTTPDVIAGRWLSAFAVLLLTALWLLERKLGRPR
jgi:hypothetical protein